jgi:pyruvate,water dikinase
MFALNRLSAKEKRLSRRLRCAVPLDILVLDLGGGVATSPSALELVEVEDLRSLPFLALLKGMTDPQLCWAGPIGFDLKGFMSVVVRSAADDQRYGEPSFALCAENYLHFSSRLAYHFATIDAMSAPSVNQNHVRFVFHGGAAVAERREWRAHFLTTVLKVNGFQATRRYDRVEAFVGKRHAEDIDASLVLLGRLMGATRHLDMVMDSQATAEAYAAAFLDGDYRFDRIRKSG